MEENKSQIIIYQTQNGETKADSTKDNMGLTIWRGNKIRKADVSIAKNYLNERDLSLLNNLVEQYLIFAQGLAMRRKPMYMKDWIEKLVLFYLLIAASLKEIA